MRNIQTITEFCDRHHACPDGRAWAIANCKDMGDGWATAKHDWLIWIATRRGVMTDKDARLFACWCVRRVWHLLKDERSKNAVRVAERFARGKATSEELDAAGAAAGDAAKVACAAAGDAAGDAMAAWAAAGAADRDARAAARAAARDAWAAARDAGDAQDKWLRKHIKPNFPGVNHARSAIPRQPRRLPRCLCPPGSGRPGRRGHGRTAVGPRTR